MAQALGVSNYVVRKMLKSKDIPTQSRSKLDVEEIRRLYVDEEWTLQRIADRFGVSRQAVNDRLRRAGVERRRTNFRRKGTVTEAVKKTLDLDNVRHLYIDCGISVQALSKTLGISDTILRRILVSEGIEIRSQKFYAHRKYPQIYDLKLGESVVMPLPDVSQPWTRLYDTATKAKIRITAKKIGPGIVKITRLS